MKLDEMNDTEKQALAGLVRLMVRIDGEFSRDEAGGLQAAAAELGEAEFWGLIEAAALRENQDEAEVKEAALKVERVQARETIYGVLYGVAVTDAIGPRENALLEWLATSWELEIKDVPAGDE